MPVQLYAFTCGHLTIPRGFMLAGEEGTIRVPVPSYLIVHPKGTALFDSGLPVPRPVAARVVRRGLTYTADMLTVFPRSERTL